MDSIWLVCMLAITILTTAVLLQNYALRLGGLGLLLTALGIASTVAAAGGDARAGLGGIDVGSLAPSVLVIGAGLAAVGAGLLAAAGMLEAARRSRLRGAITIVGAVALVVIVSPVIGGAGLRTIWGMAVVVAAGGVSLALAYMMAKIRGRWAGGEVAAAAPAPAAAPRLYPMLLLSAACVMAAPHLAIVFAAAVFAALAAEPPARRAWWRLGLHAIAVAATLLPLFWVMRTIAGPVGLRIASLPDAPFSTPAQALLALPLAAAALACCGLWRARGNVGPLVLIGVALIVRVGGALPEGFAHWQPLLVGVGVAAIWGSVWTGRAGNALAAGAWIGAVIGAAIAGGLSVASVGGWCLAVAAVLVDLPGGSQRTASAFRAAWAVGAVGTALVLQAALASEVVYAVAGVAGAAALIGLPRPVTGAASGVAARAASRTTGGAAGNAAVVTDAEVTA